jgi:HCOMODA/2-hydroxy-3-carboxy-muconic semialdehyde decarboxylase
VEAASAFGAGAVEGTTRAPAAGTPAAAGPPGRGSAVVEAARVLARLGLVTAYGHVSARAGEWAVITPAAALAGVREEALVRVRLDATTLPPGAPAEAWAHLAVYAARPDVGAVARAQPAAAFAAAALTTRLVPLYGQAAWLGEAVPVHDSAHLLRSSERARAAARTLGGADAMLLRGNGALTVGADPGLAAARMWLVEAACQGWLAAGDTATPLTPEEIRSWRAVRGELLPRLWQHLRGDTP